MRRPDATELVAIGIGVTGSAIAWSLWIASPDAMFLILAVVMQVAPGILLAWIAAPDRRALIVVVAALVPVIGPIASLYIDRERGRGGAELLADSVALTSSRRLTGAEIAQRLVGALPPCEALVSGDADARRATITQLSWRAGSEDIAILRWARNQRDADVAVEAALALNELEQRFEQNLREARAAVAAQPSFTSHAALVTAICSGVITGIVDPPLISTLAVDARVHYLEATIADPDAARELVIPCVRLELAARRPDLALALTKRALARSADPMLVQLYTEAAYAARRFDLVPGLRSREADDHAA
ncbi:MAG TPA: hypothetical protein VIV40_21230 [Kofleriaceae bacterium]